MTTCTKLYTDLPAAHRQHKHDGHCALIHGHNFSFEFTFAAETLDECGFVVDFGKLKWLKAWLGENFDHTLLLNADDPQLGDLQEFLENGHGLAKIVVVPNCGSEGLAEWILKEVNALFNRGFAGLTTVGQVDDYLRRRVHVSCVRVFEDSKNYATYYLPAAVE